MMEIYFLMMDALIANILVLKTVHHVLTENALCVNLDMSLTICTIYAWIQFWIYNKQNKK